jgi:ElaB/YqjD/DUF883 family membrane-anchored ribosome-binding protein
MNTQEEIPKVGEKLEEARRDLHETLSQFNRKVKLTEERFKPDHFVRQRPAMASSLAVAFGFVVGSRMDGAAADALIAGALLAGALRVWSHMGQEL